MMKTPGGQLGVAAVMLTLGCATPVPHWTTTPSQGLFIRCRDESGIRWMELEVPQEHGAMHWTLEGVGEVLEIQRTEAPFATVFRWRLDEARVTFWGTRGYRLCLKEGARAFTIYVSLQSGKSFAVQMVGGFTR